MRPDRPVASERPAAVRYVAAAAAVVVAALVRRGLTGSLGPTALPFITFFPAVSLTAWLGGLGPGLSAVALSASVAWWVFLDPATRAGSDVVAPLATFVTAGVLIVCAFEAMHRARRELALSRDVLATTLGSIGDGVVVTDETGRVTFLNHEAERLTGWNLADAAGRPLAEVFRIVNERTRAPTENPVERVLREGIVVGLANHTVLVARDGSETPIDDSAAPIRRGEGAVLGVVLVFRDVRAARRAAIDHARLAAIIASSGDAIIAKDLDGSVTDWNPAAEQLFGYAAAEMCGRSIRTVIPPELLGEEEVILTRIRNGSSAELVETTRLTKDGRRIPVSVRVSPIRDADGEIVGASKVVRDLSSLVAARDALAREKDLLGTTLASIGDAVIATDADGRVTFLNAVASSLSGWSAEAAVGRPLDDVFRTVLDDDREPAANPALRAMREGRIVALAGSTTLVSREGTAVQIDDSAAPIRDGGGAVVGAVLVFRDVTERRRLEGELRLRLEQLDEVSRRKSEFLATLAHELRNPLAPIRNSLTLLRIRSRPDPELDASRDVIERQVRHMSRLLDDLLDMNRLDRHRLELRRQKVLVSTVVETALETARPAIEQGRHRLEVDLPAAPVVLDADPMRLAQVFANLLNNAAKYTDTGGRIALSAVREGDEVVVSVEDSGIGIAPEGLGSLFQMFAQLPMSSERAQGGVGIGLALARGLVELHGGSIAARSDGPGRGSVFAVRLPVAQATVPPARTPDETPTVASKRRILVADDLRDNADTLAMMLRALGHEVHVAYDGPSAFAAAAALRPSVVLLDIGMPGLDGYAVCRRLRAEAWGREMVIVAQTGWGQDADRRRAEEAGFDHHMLKPVDCAKFVAVLAAGSRPHAGGRSGAGG